jgi:hypothetical protein
MPTSVTYYEDPLNIDYLIAPVRFEIGDLEGDVFTDTVVRTAIVNALRFLQNRWLAKYQIFDSSLVISPQPVDAPIGFVWANTIDGEAYIPDGLIDGDIFRNPFIEFTTIAPAITPLDEQAIILAAAYLLRRVQIASTSDELVSWSTEDIRYTNLSRERAMSALLADARALLDDYFRKKLAAPVRVEYPRAY